MILSRSNAKSNGHYGPLSDVKELLADLKRLVELSERQSQLIVLLRAQLAVATDLLIEHGLFEEYQRRIGDEEAEDGG